MAGFSREAQPAPLLGSTGGTPIGSPWLTLGLRVDSVLQSLFGQKQKCILIVKEMNGSPIMLRNICKIRAIICVIITDAELLNLVYFLWRSSSSSYITVFLSCVHLRGKSLVTSIF